MEKSRSPDEMLRKAIDEKKMKEKIAYEDLRSNYVRLSKRKTSIIKKKKANHQR